ncbi:S-layer homology domain-containing protein [Collinsella sp. An2]|uniref:S-layer homology domain-containing protein n=1 Tax=Collinsella sp. An2 TaxID=1965585 RepID=UPI001302D8F4|nr:S-layer homology domain-containing protein [Collinsella sp. An2]
MVFANEVSVTAGGTASKNYQNGVVFEGTSGTVYGSVTLPDDVTIPEGYTLTIPSGASLTVPSGTTLTNEGTVTVEDGGTFTNSGTIEDYGTITGTVGGITPQRPATVSVTVTPATATYGSTVTPMATVAGGSGVVNDGTVTFYQGTDTTGAPLNSTPANVSNGTATYELELTGANWKPGTYTIAAVYSGGAGLLGNTGTAPLTVSKATTDATPVGPISSSSRSETGITLNTVSDGNIGTYGEIQYGYVTGTETEPGHWQDGAAFTNLNPGTDYTFYTRYAGNDYYNPSDPSTTGLTVTTLPQIMTTSLDDGTVGVYYSQALKANVETGKTVTWELATGSTLPAGLTLSNDGTITGTPEGTAANHNFTVQATIQGGAPGSENPHDLASLSITINAGTPDITATTYKGEDQTSTFTYGDTITVTGTIAASSMPPAASNGINAITEPAQDQVGLYVSGNDSLIATANVTDGSFTLKYNTADKAIPTGQPQTLTVKYGGSSTLNSGSTTVQITLNKKAVTAQVQGAITKVYNGNTDAAVSLAVAADDLVKSTDNIIVTGTGTYQSAGVGTNIPVTVSITGTSGNDTDWYTVTAPTGVTGSIMQSSTELKVEPSSASLTYGDTLTLTVAPCATGEAPAQNTLLAGLHRLVDLLTDANGDTVELYNGDKLLAGTSKKNADGSYTLTYNTADKGLSVGNNTLTVKFNGDTNMVASEASVTVTLKRKEATASVSGTPSKTYDSATDVTVSLAFDNGVLVDGDSFTGTVAGSFSDANAGEGKSITLGTTPTWSNDTIAGFYDIALPGNVTGNILKARPGLSLAADHGQLLGGGRVVLTIEGLPEGAAAEVSCSDSSITVTGEGSSWEAYLPNRSTEYTFMATSSETVNYSAGQASCSVDVSYSAPPVPTYPPTVDAGAGGTVEVSPARPHKDQTVTVEPVPDEGQEVREVVVTDKDGKPVEVVDNGDGTWSFVQPAGKVIIEVSFGCDGGELCATHGFVDVDQGAWYHDAIDWAVDAGVLHGYDGTGLMGPDDVLTRAQLATIISNVEGAAPGNPSALDGFTDADPDAWYAGTLSWAVSEGLFSGYDGTSLMDPDGALTREQAAAVLMRWAALRGEDTSQRADLSDYPDATDVSPWARECMSWAVATGVVSGVERADGSPAILDPVGTATRAQAAALMMRLLAGE